MDDSGKDGGPRRRGRLAGAGVLVTRPAHQAEGMAARVRAEGGMPRPFPLLAVEFLPDPGAAKQALARLRDDDWLVAVSPNAVAGLVRLLERARMHLPAVRFAAVGEATAAALREQGWDPQAWPETGEGAQALLDATVFSPLDGCRVGIARAQGGRRVLDKALPARGAEVIDLPLYRRLAPTLDPDRLAEWLAEDRLHIVTVTSAGSVNHLARVAAGVGQGAIYRLPVVAPSERVLKQAAQQGFSGPLLAANDASDKAMVETAADWWQRNRTNP